MTAAAAFVGDPVVRTTENRGHTLEEVSDMAIDRIMSVSSKAPPVIRDQAEAFKRELKSVLLFYMKMAVEQDRATVCAKIREAGSPELALYLRGV
jgi:hypothetical protein|tara:strand:+ start:77 stop:361 length:285 start_codon:yes stop_codon:yes gene_type:complete